MSTDFMKDPFWYKDAVIYELHVRSFFDATNDGYGDFAGMRQKLPYLESLGVNTLWLLPFLESPLRDDGYDTADYYKILPVHGTLDDFKAFLDEAHARGMRVVTELVLNHTSDQHPWFQEARNPASPRHHWYVWSETPEKYKETRIIFTDTEVSNWSWDQKAQKYFWHRFFSHQPDLNYDNPEVREAMTEVMFFWLDLGVDGLRLDAVPYLYEREGTNCENLPETIDFIVELRQAIEARYGPGKVLLAEANQWPEDTLPYFASGRGVQMAFNFPIMPRMYMALRRENRRPLVEMLELTQDIPEEAQWAVFLRNHDELTLEMVTDEERDYMWHEYAADPRFRINVGIRRRLAPLLGGDRRRIELLTALLLSLKGTPVLYYGDEIGMGDDPFLGDRNGVRTPMQWSPDKNGGFSRAPHHRLFMPAIGKGPYSYEFINVEDAEADPNSLLHFTRRMLAQRRQYEQVFGRGTFEVVPVDNQQIFAFLREHEGKKILVTANLSRFPQSFFLPPSERYEGLVPVEVFSKAPFPKLEERRYHMILAPHGFFWFVLEPEEVAERYRYGEVQPHPAAEEQALATLRVPEGIHNLLVKTMAHGHGMEQLEILLPEYVKHRRWYGAKEREISQILIEDAVRIDHRPQPLYLALLDVRTADGGRDLYTLPLTLSHDGAAQQVLETVPHTAIAWVEGPDGRGLLHDATALPDFWLGLFHWWQAESKGRSLKGLYSAAVAPAVRGTTAETARLLTGEQSNSSGIVGGRFFVKLYRHLEEGINPETELLGYLTAADFKFIPKLYGTVTFKSAEGSHALGILQEALPVETDGWNHALEVTKRFLDRVAEMSPPEDGLPTSYKADVPGWLEDVAPEMLSVSRILGVRTAELHLTLAKATAPALAPEAATSGDTEALLSRIRAEAEETRRMLEAHRERLGTLPEPAAWERALRRLERLRQLDAPRQKIRVHGDYHLGQVLLAQGEFYLLDFEGEPARSIEERRRRDDALRDVAGMLRSLEYAVLAAWQKQGDQRDRLRAWAAKLVRWCEATFLNTYFSTAEEGTFILPRGVRRPFLWAYLFDKALYEVRYELNSRPDWAWLPLTGLRRLLEDPTWEEAREPEAMEA